MNGLVSKIIRKTVSPIKSLQYANRQKVFCIGKNKTGTTSMAKLFEELGLVVGNQQKAEKLTLDWIDNKYKRILRYSKYGGEAFQDIPFSLPNTYKILDKAFPNSKFILTERKSPEIWCDSLIKFHSRVFGNGNIPTKEDLQKATYVDRGFAWQMMNKLHVINDNDVYNKEMLIRDYLTYNKSVKEYFSGQEDKLLVVTLEDSNVVKEIKDFLGTTSNISIMPWKNKTQ